MTRVKICGITNLKDAQAAIHCGADALGFIFVADTPRYVGTDWFAIRIPRYLPPFINTVAVYGDASDVHSRWRANFNFVQYYTNEIGIRLPDARRQIRAVRVRDQESLRVISDHGIGYGAILLDAYHPDKLGGSGATFDWELAREAKERFGKPIILAGGLTPDNVGDAIAAVRPYAVDVSSGVEAEPGRKDYSKLKAFIDAVRKSDSKT